MIRSASSSLTLFGLLCRLLIWIFYHAGTTAPDIFIVAEQFRFAGKLATLAPHLIDRYESRRIFTLPARHCELNGPNLVSLSPLSDAGTTVKPLSARTR